MIFVLIVGFYLLAFKGDSLIRLREEGRKVAYILSLVLLFGLALAVPTAGLHYALIQEVYMPLMDPFIFTWKTIIPGLPLMLFVNSLSPMNLAYENSAARFFRKKSYPINLAIWILSYIISYLGFLGVKEFSQDAGLFLVSFLIWGINILGGTYQIPKYLIQRKKYHRSVVATLGILMFLFPLLSFFLFQRPDPILLNSLSGINIFLFWAFGKEKYGLYLE